MSEIMLNPELCQEVVENLVGPHFRSLRESEKFGRSEGSLIIAQLLPGESDGLQEYFEEARLADGPDKAFYEKYVLYEHSWGENKTGIDQIDVQPATFTRKALEKVFGAILHGKDYDKVLAENRHDVERRALIAFPGAVIRDITPPNGEIAQPLVAVGYSGLWWWHDVMISEVTAASIRAELSKRTHEA